MMMFDDALEPEFEDLGAEFAAQCAAENTYAQLDQPQPHQATNDTLFSAHMQDNTPYQINSSYGYDMAMDNINQHEMMNQVHHVEEVATSSNQGNHIYQQENIHDPRAGNSYSQEMTTNYIQQDPIQHPSSSFENYNSPNIYQQENGAHQVPRPAVNQYYQLPYGSEGQVMMQAPQRTVTIDQQGRRMIVQRQPVYQQQNIQTSQGIYNQSLQHQSLQREVQQRQPSVVYVRRVPGNNGASSQQVYIQTPQGLVARPQPVRVVRTVNQNGQPVTVIQRRIQRPVTQSDGHQDTSQSQMGTIVRMGERNEMAAPAIPNGGALNGSHQFSHRADRSVPVSQPSGSTLNAPLYHPHQKIVQYRPVHSVNTPQPHTVFKQNSVVHSFPENINNTDASQLRVSHQSNSSENFVHNPDVSQSSIGCNSGTSSASSSSTSISSIIPTARPPVPPIPRKKKPEAPVVAATDIAQAAALQRIGTEEGWKQMNTWLKSAGSDEKTSQIKDLLKQCLQAKVSVDLLLSNDTPKFVRQLSKTHSDTEVKKLSSQCVVKWKKEVANPEVPSVKKEKKSKDQQPEVLDDEEMDSASPQREESSFENSLSREEKTKEAKRSERKKSGDNVENNESEKGEKRNKAKARVYTAKSRLTGLETDSADQPAVKKAKKDDEKPISSDEKTKKDESTLSAKLPSLPKIPKKVKPVVPTTPQKVTLSTGFMDALSVSKEPKKKVPVKKRSIDKKKEEPLPPAPLSVLDGLFAEQAKQVEIGGPKTFLESTASNSPAMPKAPSPVIDEDDSEMIPQSRRKIRFADEFGKDLVMIKEFEIEEGERINVNHMSPEDMKHHEMLMERRNKEQNTDIDDDEDKKPEIPWRLCPLIGSHVSAARGSESQAKLLELERQKNAMRAFNDPSRPTTVFAEPDDVDLLSARRHVSPIIPLEPVDAYDEQNSDSIVSEPAAAQVAAPSEEPEKSSPSLNVSSLPSSLQNLLDGLKKQGIVGGGQATSVVPNVSSLVSSLSTATLATINNKFPPTTNVSSAELPQQTYQQIPLNGPVITGGNTYQQQMLPPVIHQVHPSTSSSQGHYDVDDAGHDSHRPFNGPRPMGRVCQFFNTPRGCNFGDNCKFVHDDRAQPSGHPRGFYRDRENRGARGDWDRRGGDWESGRGRERDYDNREADRRDHRRDWGEREFRGRGRGFGGRGGFRGGRYDDRPPFRSYKGGDRGEHRDAREFGRSPNDYGSGADDIQSPMQSPADYIQSPNDKSATGSTALVIPSERLPSTNSPASPQQE